MMHVLADSKSQRMRDRLCGSWSAPCPECEGSGLRPEPLAVTFLGHSIAEVNGLAFTELVSVLRPAAELPEETHEVAVRICADLVARIEVLLDLGLGYLSLGRNSTTLSPGETQRLRIATQLRSGLFGVVYVLDEPSAGLHPADTEPLLDVLDRLKASGNSLFVVEHDLDVVRRADWVVDIGPGAGEAEVECSTAARWRISRASPSRRPATTYSGVRSAATRRPCPARLVAAGRRPPPQPA